MYKRILCVLTFILVAAVNGVAESATVSVEDAERALEKAVTFFRDEVSVEGGYLWLYSSDLRVREGEGKATETLAWVQPPGTPSIGLAYLEAYEMTGDKYLLDAATETARALVYGQLESGGWDYRIEFDPKRRGNYAYRKAHGNPEKRNVSTLDDNTTQEALRCLMQVDKALGFKDKSIHEAAMFGLESLLKVQYPNGAWPQRYSEFPSPEKFEVKCASYPETWSRTFPSRDYRGFYTFNDNAIADLIDIMFQASEVYGDDRYRAAAEKAGDFIILAQMPDPQPAWAQQYDLDMRPAWARKFEPPSVTGGESQGVMRTLMKLYRLTGKKKYLEPIPRALEFLNKSRLADGRLARFYELETNRPLYFTIDYKLTYSSADMPTHYAFIVTSTLDAIESEYEKVKRLDPDESSSPKRRKKPRASPALIKKAAEVVAGMDERGAWVEKGGMRKQVAENVTHVISTQTFVGRVRVLSWYIAASR